MSILITLVASIDAAWKPVGGQLLASGVLLLSGHQDLGLRTRIGAACWFFIALAFSVSALGTAVWMRLWGGVAICTAILCFETWLVRHLWNRKKSP